MRIVTEPTVVVLARTAADPDGVREWSGIHGSPDWTTDAPSHGEAVIEAAGRTCYASFATPRPGGNAAYVARLIESGHTSVLEHASWTLGIAGVSRDLTHELVRHRVGMSYSQRSTRYCDEGNAAFVSPPLLPPSDGDEFRVACRFALSRYLTQVESLTASGLPRKAARGAARSVLPGATETRIVVTGNARAWMHFLKLRGSEAAEAEIRRLAVAVADVLKQEAPNVFADVNVSGGIVAVGNPKA